MSKTTAGPARRALAPLQLARSTLVRSGVVGSWVRSWLDGRRPSKRSLTTGEPTGGAPGQPLPPTLDPGRCVAHGAMASPPHRGSIASGRGAVAGGPGVPGSKSWSGHLAGSTPSRRRRPRAPGLTLDVPLGRRVMVVGDLLLEATPRPRRSPSPLTWPSPSTSGRAGLVIVCGNLFNLGAEERPLESGEWRARSTSTTPSAAIAAFTARDDCRLLVLPGWGTPRWRAPR